MIQLILFFFWQMLTRALMALIKELEEKWFSLGCVDMRFLWLFNVPANDL